MSGIEQRSVSENTSQNMSRGVSQSGSRKVGQNASRNVQQKSMTPEEYKEYVKEKTPVSNLFANMAKAFVVGGTICVIGQTVLNYCKGLGMEDC